MFIKTNYLIACMSEKRGILIALTLAILILTSCTSQEPVKEEKSKISECTQLSEKTVQECSKNENWQVLKEGMPYLGTYDCKPNAPDSNTKRLEFPVAQPKSLEKDVVLIADEDVWNKIQCSDNPSNALSSAIDQNKVKIEKKGFVSFFK